MNIFIRELARNRKYFLIWTIIMVLLDVMMMAFYPTIADMSKNLDELIKSYPKELLEAFGMDKLKMSELIGYFGTQVYVMIILLGAIFAMILGASIISKEEGEKTIEFLLSKPVTRTGILNGKGLCVLVYILLFNVIISLGNYIAFEIVKTKEYDMKAFLLMCVAPMLVQYTFAALGFLLSVFISKSRTVFPVALGITLGTYFIGIASSMTEKAENLKYLSPFRYIDAADLVVNKSIQGVYLLIMAVVTISSVIGAYVFYKKKNIMV